MGHTGNHNKDISKPDSGCSDNSSSDNSSLDHSGSQSDELENLDIQIESTSKNLPTRQQFECWLIGVLPQEKQHHDITIRIVDKAESQELNAQYRQKDKPTNVLSFSADLPADIDLPLLGDLVICAGVVEDEAHDQKKELQAHWAHMVTHGTLHLLGYDHETSHEAHIMEGIEIQCMKQLGYSNPYEDNQ